MIPRAACASAACLAAVLMAGCASNPTPAPPAGLAPKFPSYLAPEIPAALRVAPDVRTQHEIAWRRLQAGDLGGARRDFSTLLKKVPDFYPSIAGLAYAALADRDYTDASNGFADALWRNDAYLPAWMGKAEAELGAGREDEAVVALERILAIDPKREAVRARLDLVRFRQLQALVESGRKAREAGRLDDAERDLERALTVSPSSTSILRELALVKEKAGALDQAEAHLKRVVQLEPGEVDDHVALAALLERRQKYTEAAAEFSKAVAIDPRPEWRRKIATLRASAYLAAMPEEFRDTASRPALTRGEVAAYIAIKLPDLIEQAPARPVSVATDVRTHWAAAWIAPITRAGVMTVYENHTFQPGAAVRRNDLAEMVAALVTLAATGQPGELAKWRAARPRFPDLPQTNIYYRAVALGVTAGALTLEADGRFLPTRPATGADLVRAVARVEALAPQ